MKNFILVVSFVCSLISFGQTDSIVLASVKTIHSTKLNEYRILNIYLPDGYQKDTASNYPVLYVLDGSANEDFIHIVGLVQFMVMCGEMEPTIVVGIANVDRKRDFTFPTTIEKDKVDFPTTGGSANFISCLKSELIPYIDSNYNTNYRRTLIGQSLGGLVATEILLTETNLFTDYLIVSPSLWWDKESLIAKFQAAQLDFTIYPIYLGVGEKEPAVMVKDAKKINKILKKKQAKMIELEILKGQDHGNVLHQAAFNGLRFLNPKPEPKVH